VTAALDARPEVGSRRTAIVCDDDAMTRRLVGQVLAKLDIEVVADIDIIPNLVPVVRMTRPELVVLDLWLEGTTGLSALPELLALTPPPAVVVYSGREEWTQRALDAGAAAFVDKPDFAELEAAVSRLVPTIDLTAARAR
jgi:DNA-binding NarL/FixJ family response regulator